MRFRRFRFKFNKRKILTLTTIVVIFVMSLGYAALSQHMDIDGIASIDRSWIVKITNVTASTTGTATDVSHTYVGTTVTMNANLPTSSDTITYTITLENQGNLSAKLSTIDQIEDENYSIEYTIDGVKTSYTVLKPGETNTATVTFKYKSGVSNASTTEKSVMISFNYVENSGSSSNNSGNSTSTSEYIAYKPGDAVMFDPGTGTKQLFYVVSTSDTTSSSTVQLIPHNPSGTSTISSYSTYLTNLKTTWTNINSAILPNMATLYSLSGLTFDSSTSQHGASPALASWLLGPSVAGPTTLTSTTYNGSYYVITNSSGTATLSLQGSTATVGIRPLVTVSKTKLNAKYSTYKVGDYVTLTNGEGAYVVRGSGTSNAMVTVLLAPTKFSREFDSSGSNDYNIHSSTNIGYYLNNTYLPTLKTALDSGGGNSAGTAVRLLTVDEFNNIKNYSNAWDDMLSSITLMMTEYPDTDTYVYALNQYADLEEIEVTAPIYVRPVLTLLKENVESVDLGYRVYKIDNVASEDSAIDFSKPSSYANRYYSRTTNSSTSTSFTSSSTYYFGKSYSFDESTGKYTLVTTTTSTWANMSSNYATYPYTCKLTSNGTCSTLYKMTAYSSTTSGTAYTMTSSNIKYYDPHSSGTSQTMSSITSSYYYGAGYTFNPFTGSYTLTDTVYSAWSNMSSSGTYPVSTYRYRCSSGSATTCATMYEMTAWTNSTSGTYMSHDRTAVYDIGTNGDGLYYTSENTLDGGTTYYFRGNVENNYVKFAGHYWRILRVNEDGNVRLIYQGTTANQGTGSAVTSLYAPGTGYNAYVGYMYGSSLTSTNASDSTNSVHYPVVNNTIKNTLDNWYTTNLADYGSYLADSGFCNDRITVVGDGSADNTSSYAWSSRQTAPVFKCSSYETRDLFTTTSSSIGNKKLTNPIGLITADEAVYAGASASSTGSDYMKNFLRATGYFWTMTPYRNDYSAYKTYVAVVSSTNVVMEYDVNYTALNVRPVINLKAGVSYLQGTGTATDPYIIEG